MQQVLIAEERAGIGIDLSTPAPPNAAPHQEETDQMLFKCLPPGAPIPGRFPGPVHARGKWFTVDIHCHVLTPKAAEMVAGNAGATRHPREIYANERTREVNRQQAERNRVQFTSVEKRLADMDLMGIDIQAMSPVAEPDLLRCRPRSRHRHRADRQR